MLILLIIHYASALFMTGVIWIVQIVHYPLFRKVGPKAFKDFESAHTTQIGLIVIPVMIVELASGIYILFSDFLNKDEYLLFVIASITLIIIWLSTMLIQARQHRGLSAGYDLTLINSLVGYNWIRTIGWSFRAVVLTLILMGVINSL